MTENLKSKQGLKEFRQKLSLGLVETPQRLDPIEKAKQNPKSFRSAINAMCFDCIGFERLEVKNCEFTNCPLYQHRSWKNKASA